MGTAFWIKRFLTVVALVFVVLTAAALLRGRTLETALVESAIWSVITSAIFTGVRIYRSRKRQYCAICNDVPPEPHSK
jgi:hypothetical protein